MENEMYELNNGVKTPTIGYGTWLIDNEEVTGAVKTAIKLGYRHIDTAQGYDNEKGVGKGIRESGVNREEIFITTKLRAEVKDFDQAVTEIDKSLENLGVEYIDLLLVHSPKPWDQFLNDDHYFQENLEAWRALEQSYELGKVRAIGVSNFDIDDLKNILNNAKITPSVNQILAHIGEMPTDLINFSNDHNILVEAYSPFGHGDIFADAEIENMANKYNVPISQIAVKYLLQQGLLPLPKALSEKHMIDNLIVDFDLTQGDIEILNGIDKIEPTDATKNMYIYKKK